MQFGYESLTDLARKIAARDLSEAPRLLDEEIRAWSGGMAVGDDVTTVVLRMTGEAGV